jgi:hypothetical protein
VTRAREFPVPCGAPKCPTHLEPMPWSSEAVFPPLCQDQRYNEDLERKLRRRDSQSSDGGAEMCDSTRSSDQSTVHWDEQETMLPLPLPHVQDPTSYSHHDAETVFGIEEITLILDVLSQAPPKKSGQAIRAGLLASGHPLFRSWLASVSSDVEALRYRMTPRSHATSQLLNQVKAEPSTRRITVERLSSDQDTR